MLTKTYACLLAFQLVMLASLPTGPWQQIVLMLSASAVTLLLWIELDGRAPAFVAGGVGLLGLLAGSPAAATAAIATGVILYLLKGRPSCAESSAR
jgi:hypothetical protein